MNRLNFSRWGLFFSLIISIFLWVSCGNSSSEEKNITPKEIKEYFISCDSTELSTIYANYRENTYIPIKITFKGETVVARMRIRGDTSREDPKKSLKIKFDSLFVEGLPKVINLNAEYADKTYIRQYASSLLMQKSGQICYQSEHIKVYVNDKFFGLYLQVENMDDDFLKRNNLDKNGNLYKATKDGA